MLQVENPVVPDLPMHNPQNYDSEAYWYFHADDGSDAQDETHYCTDLQRRLEDLKSTAKNAKHCTKWLRKLPTTTAGFFL